MMSRRGSKTLIGRARSRVLRSYSLQHSMFCVAVSVASKQRQARPRGVRRILHPRPLQHLGLVSIDRASTSPASSTGGQEGAAKQVTHYKSHWPWSKSPGTLLLGCHGLPRDVDVERIRARLAFLAMFTPPFVCSHRAPSTVTMVCAATGAHHGHRRGGYTRSRQRQLDRRHWSNRCERLRPGRAVPRRPNIPRKPRTTTSTLAYIIEVRESNPESHPPLLLRSSPNHACDVMVLSLQKLKTLVANSKYETTPTFDRIMKTGADMMTVTPRNVWRLVCSYIALPPPPPSTSHLFSAPSRCAVAPSRTSAGTDRPTCT